MATKGWLSNSYNLPRIYEFLSVFVSSNSHKGHNKDYYCDNKDYKDSWYHSTYDGCIS